LRTPGTRRSHDLQTPDSRRILAAAMLTVLAPPSGSGGYYRLDTADARGFLEDFIAVP